MTKKPKFRTAPIVSKTVPSRSPSENPVSWRVGSVETDGPWPWTGLSPSNADRLRQVLSSIEQYGSWGAAIGNNFKAIPVSNLTAAALRRLEQKNNEDLSALVQIHLGGKPRAWGIQRGSACHLIWWDPKHEVCPTNKKHT